MPQTVISEQDFNKLKSNGTIYICRSCLDNNNKFVMLEYKAGEPQVVSGFCPACIKTMTACRTCGSNSNKR